jgi:predicted nicotinamide N-methyase
MQAHERVRELCELLETTQAADARRSAALELCEAMTRGGASAVSYADSLGAKTMLIKALNAGMRDGDDEVMDVVGAALGKMSQMAKREAYVELRTVPGSQVGSAASRPPMTVSVHLPFSGKTVRVCESAWADAGLAWRVWGGAHMLSRFLDAEPKRVAGKDVLEIGAGCGLCGLTAATLGARRVVISDGAPGALGAIAASVNELPEKNASMAFLDFRDDEDILNGTVSVAEARATNELRHWVHANPKARKEIVEASKLSVDEAFDVVIATDVLYSEEHAAALAACITRRLRRGGSGYILNACRHSGLMSSFITELLSRGLSLRLSAVERFEAEQISEYQGGHLHRALPEESEDWWTSCAKTLSTTDSFLIAESETLKSLAADPLKLEEFIAPYEGRFVFVHATPRAVDTPASVFNPQASLENLSTIVAMTLADAAPSPPTCNTSIFSL